MSAGGAEVDRFGRPVAVVLDVDSYEEAEDALAIPSGSSTSA